MPFAIRLAVIVSAVLFAVTSTTINLSFLSSLGRTQTETAVFGGVSLASDVARLALPVVIGAALRARRHLAAGAALLMLFPVVVLSLASGAGFAAATRGNVLAERTETAARAQYLQKRQAELDRRRLAMVSAGEVGPLKAAVDGRNRDARWNSSAQCSVPRGADERRWCTAAAGLDVQLATAQAREALDTERQQIASELHAVRAALGDDQPDPQAAALSKLLAAPPDLIRAGFALGIAVVLELGSAILVYLAVEPFSMKPALNQPHTPDAKKDTKSEPELREVVSRPADVPPQIDRAHWQKRRPSKAREGHTASGGLRHERG